MPIPTWGQLVDNFCSNRKDNPHYEEMAVKRYNFAAYDDMHSCRLIFLKGVLEDKNNKTLRRKGRFIWCRNFQYEGVNREGFRSISFTIDKGKKRFHVGENNILCLPSSICVTRNRFFNSKQKIFSSFSTVFSYDRSMSLLAKGSRYSLENLRTMVQNDNPFRPGTLVMPKVGYFQPSINTNELNKEISSGREHPCGIILGPSIADGSYVSREFYRVRFGNTTYDRVHPVQMEIINEV